MQISQTLSHGKVRFRVNIERKWFRKRLFFRTFTEAEAFALATGGKFKVRLPQKPTR